ncbi:TetR/AcrR family transcriptional regulator C-terminal domain-containing protein [Nocardia cyriacigeorgica]|nr:TetR/AcrR family transcriptional regulator C-terminal domain-containing protein [Nocardia cyriacigeorgica]
MLMAADSRCGRRQVYPCVMLWMALPGRHPGASALSLLAVLLGDPALRTEYQRVAERHGAGPRVAVDRLADYLRAEQELGRLRDEVDPRVAAMVLVGVAQNVVITELATGSSSQPDGDLDDIGRHLATFLAV